MRLMRFILFISLSVLMTLSFARQNTKDDATSSFMVDASGKATGAENVERARFDSGLKQVENTPIIIENHPPYRQDKYHQADYNPAQSRYHEDPQQQNCSFGQAENGSCSGDKTSSNAIRFQLGIASQCEKAPMSDLCLSVSW